ncbi:type II toxin-antitoxin system RelE/ParE family toxin [Salmonella enterica subsp. enterica serovar Typhi]|nr:type II toxin-antitoxin system RelE/ParE family toxin [Salmonella enterica subsp. enterica serovar Typhi]EFG9152971.1 type II toxin-antitoxin system RelE/ParE family toxin [Escherichia coli]MIL10021.1 type II toxin-antitoxin system RelE/ParE family toxin [Salmonella enterica subsp. enterica serovar Enteritidis]
MEIRLTATFTNWLARLQDDRGRDRVIARLRRFELGNLGDVKPVGQGVSEARIDYGPRYRLYFVRRGSVLLILLCGGTKKTQASDIRSAQQMARELSDDH